MKSRIKQVAAALTAFIVAATMIVSNNSNKPEITTEAASYQEQINEYQQQLEDYKQQQAEIDAQLQQNKNDLENEKAYQEDLLVQIDTVENTLEVLSNYILQLKKDISACETDIADKEKAIEEKKVEIEEGKQAFMARLRAMYIAGEGSYSSLILSADGLYDMLMKTELVKRVADYDNKIISELYDLKKQLEAEEEALEIKKQELEVQMTEYNTQKEEQDVQREKLSGLYAESQESAEELEGLIIQGESDYSELEGEMMDIQDVIDDLVAQEEQRKKEEEERKRREEEERKKQEALAQQNQQSGSSDSSESSNNSGSSSSSDDSFQYGSGIFAWPVPGYYNITSGVGWRWGAYHKGIDISSYGIRGANICASDSGTVVKVNNSCSHDYGKSGSCGCGGGYGNYCIINHGNGYMTLYGHAQYMNVSVGQKVNQGDVLGIVGSTGFSTGDHLHFEILLNGVAQNPLNYL